MKNGPSSCVVELVLFLLSEDLKVRLPSDILCTRATGQGRIKPHSVTILLLSFSPKVDL